MARDGREIELQALATLAALAQISTPSAAHFLKSHQLLVQKFAADRDRQKGPFDGARPKVILNGPRIVAIARELVSRAMSQHVCMNLKGQSRLLTRTLHQPIEAIG